MVWPLLPPALAPTNSRGGRFLRIETVLVPRHFGGAGQPTRAKLTVLRLAGKALFEGVECAVEHFAKNPALFDPQAP